MNNKTKLTLVTMLIAVLVAGCAEKPPTCSDESTFSLIRKIVVNQIGGREGVTDKELQDNMKIEYPRASSFDQSIKKYSCEGKLVAGGTVEMPITYESQLDDKDQHIVVVGGIAKDDLITIQQAIIEGIKKSRVAKVKSSNLEPQSQIKSVPDNASNLLPAPKTDAINNQTEVPLDKTTEPVALPVSPPANQQAVFSPSFDCANASTGTERLICSNQELATLDVEMMSAYKRLTDGNPDKNALKKEQNDWMKNQRNTCSTSDCMAKAYRSRIENMESTAQHLSKPAEFR